MLLAFVWMSSRHLNENNKQRVCLWESVCAFHWENDVRAAGACPTGLSRVLIKKKKTLYAKDLTTGPQGIYFHLPIKGMDNINGPGSSYVPTILHLF